MKRKKKKLNRLEKRVLKYIKKYGCISRHFVTSLLDETHPLTGSRALNIVVDKLLKKNYIHQLKNDSKIHLSVLVSKKFYHINIQSHIPTEYEISTKPDFSDSVLKKN